MTARLDRLRSALPELDVHAALVAQPTNVRYLIGFASSNATLLVSTDHAWLFTDGRYIHAARDVPDVEPVHAERDLFGDLAGRLPGLVAGPIAFEADHLTVAQHGRLADGGATLVPTTKLVERLRAVKDGDELEAVRQSAALLNTAFERLARERVAGRTEAELAWWVERTIRDLGADAVSFAPIVASGPNAALPHHRPGARVVEPGGVVLVDAGAVVDSYCSDCTRTFAVGELPSALQRAYEVCLEAQLRSLEAVTAGVSAQAVDAVARGIIREQGYEVMHGLGHGVGLAIHEEPRLADTSTDELTVANVVTVEPGVYLSGVGGVRIEDLVIVSDESAEVLTSVTKELVTLS